MAKSKLISKGTGLARLMKLGKQLERKPHTKVGVLGKSAGRQASTLDNVGLAVVHEFGVARKGIPSRPFLRSTFDAKKDEWNKLLARLVAKAVVGAVTVQQVLGLLGQRASADVKRRITSGKNFEPLKPETIKRKGSSRPLVDTGRLLGSISYEVKENNR